jgi:hypothetical protein
MTEKIIISGMTILGLLLIISGLVDLGLQVKPIWTVAILGGIAAWQVGDWIVNIAVWTVNKLE